MTTKTELVRTFSHDIKNSLASIQSYLFLLYRELEKGNTDNLPAYKEKIENKIQTALSQVEELTSHFPNPVDR